MDALIHGLIQQGGLGLLAGAAIYVILQMHRRSIEDLKAAAERERALLASQLERERTYGERQLEALVEVRVALTNLADEVSGLRSGR